MTTFWITDPWKPVEEYSVDKDGWGEEVLVICSSPHGPVRLLAHKEAGMWLTRDTSEWQAWVELTDPPIYFFEIPPAIVDLHTEPRMILGTHNE